MVTSDAEEVFSQTCLDIWGGPEKFRWKSSFRTWACAICHNNSVRHLREKLSLDEQALLNLRIDREMSWRDVALVMLGNQADHDEDSIKSESNACRKRFERTKAKLRDLADSAGLLD